MNYELIKPYIEKKLVSEQVHPENENIRIFNYTQSCQFEGAWDDITKQCRGLIMNVATGEVLARPFPKFFNYQEHVAKGWNIPAEEPQVYEKLDGSLGILYWLNDVPWIATRGSFKSDQAIWATEWFRKNIDHSKLNREWTYLFEIIYPENRIVVNYEYSGLVFISSRWTKGGDETGNPYPPFLQTGGEMKRAERYPFSSIESLLEIKKDNFEGFVLYYPTENLRVKIKLSEYVRLHKILTGLSEIGIWEALSEDKKLEITDVPDEFFQWMTKVQHQLMKKYAEIETVCKNDFTALNHAGRSRKEIALGFKECKHPGILFSILDGKDYRKAIWRMIRPKGASAFKKDIDL